MKTKRNKKSVTVVDEGLSYREISEIMTSQGQKMNTSSVRHIITKGFSKVVKSISKEYGLKYSDEEIVTIAMSPEFQKSLITILRDKNEQSQNKSLN